MDKRVASLPPSGFRSSKSIKRMLGVLLTLGLLYYLFVYIDFKDIAIAFSRISPGLLLVSFALYLALYLFRTLRFVHLNNSAISFRDMFSIVCIHNFFNNIVPLRIGELSYVYLVNRQKSGTTGMGIATLIVARVFDFLLLILFALVTFLLFPSAIVIPPTVYYTILAITLLLLFGLYSLLHFKSHIISVLRIFVRLLHLEKLRFIRTILDKIKESLENFRVVSSRRTMYLSTFSTTLTLFAQYLFSFLLIRGMGITFSFTDVIVGSLLILLVGILPIQGVGGFGTYEGAWTLVFLYFGVPSAQAIPAAFVLHFLQLFFLIALGAFGMIDYRVRIGPFR
ncbi:MAG: lysylphosphatidylglycerol synthase transmembrane domain-containing protein [Nanoarchaeota archaeon]|nr:lysylphosphatidylglycerol synthase transmembrane domain-containing protein [Nanoarchaeota archaeon]